MAEVVEDPKVDRSTWSKGPWDDEPQDREEWRYKGYPCLMVRNNMGAWCGYVGISKDHPDYGKYDEVNVSVHGGITYANECAGKICHIPREGETADIWWLGFDCAHAGDTFPGIQTIARAFLEGIDMGTYKTAEWVKSEVERLADQLTRREADASV